MHAFNQNIKVTLPNTTYLTSIGYKYNIGGLDLADNLTSGKEHAQAKVDRLNTTERGMG